MTPDLKALRAEMEPAVNNKWTAVLVEDYLALLDLAEEAERVKGEMREADRLLAEARLVIEPFATRAGAWNAHPDSAVIAGAFSVGDLRRAANFQGLASYPATTEPEKPEDR